MKRKNHIRVQYLLIKYFIDNGDLSLKYCPTEEMFADFFTKPLQGETFRSFWDVIQGIPKSIPYVYMTFHRSVTKVTSQECVQHNDKLLHKISTGRTGVCGSTCTDVSAGSTRIYGITFVDVYTERTSVSVRTWTEVSTGSTVVRGSTCTGDKDKMQQPKLTRVKPVK